MSEIEQGIFEPNNSALVSRRRILSGAAAFIAMSTIGCAPSKKPEAPKTPPYFAPRATPTVINPDAALFREEHKKRGIVFSQQEHDLWEVRAFKPIQINRTLNESDSPLVHERLMGLFNLMAQSRNPHFTSTTKIIDDIRSSLLVRYGDAYGEKTIYSVSHSFDGNKLGYDLEVNAQALLRVLAQEQAQFLHHEGTHLETIRGVIQANIHSTPAEIDNILNDNFSNYEYRLQEEVKGYASQAEANIVHTGLMGQRRPGFNNELTLRYIKAKCNPKDPEWVKHISGLIQK